MPRWKTWKLSQIEPTDARALFMSMRNDGKSTSAIRKLRAALSALFAAAIEGGLVTFNPVRRVRIPPPRVDEESSEERAKAMTRAELVALLSAIQTTGTSSLSSWSTLVCAYPRRSG